VGHRSLDPALQVVEPVADGSDRRQDGVRRVEVLIQVRGNVEITVDREEVALVAREFSLAARGDPIAVADQRLGPGAIGVKRPESVLGEIRPGGRRDLTLDRGESGGGPLDRLRLRSDRLDESLAFLDSGLDSVDRGSLTLGVEPRPASERVRQFGAALLGATLRW